MADEQIGEAIFALQVAQQIDDLGLHRNIESRSRLVQHDHARAQHQGAGDGDALALAAGKLMRIAVAHRRAEADLAKHRVDARVNRPRPVEAKVGRSVHAQPLANDLGDAEARAETAIGVLENHLQALPETAQGGLRQAGQRRSHEDNPPLGPLQAEKGHRQGGFAGPAFADHAQGLAGA